MLAFSLGSIRKVLTMRKLLLFVCFWSVSVFSVPAPDAGQYMLPLSCAELLPDMNQYIVFFEAVGRGNVTTDRKFSKRIFRILGLREKLMELGDRGKEQNPVDLLIRKTLCFYREQKEPLKPVGYDDDAFLKFLKGALRELETKVDDAVFQWELERQQRKELERMALKNQVIVESLLREAEIEADSTFYRLSKAAKRKAKSSQ